VEGRVLAHQRHGVRLGQRASSYFSGRVFLGPTEAFLLIPARSIAVARRGLNGLKVENQTTHDLV